MTEREVNEVNAELAEHWPDVPYTEDQLETMHRDHLASVEAELTKTRDLLLDDDKALAFWKRYRGEM